MKTQRLSLSPTILDSFAYYLSIDNDEQSEVKRQEIIARFDGKEIVKSEAMQKGIDFEATVLKCCNEPDKFSYENDKCVVEIADMVRGGIYQHSAVCVCGDVYLHCIMDFLKANTVYDVKTTSKYEIGKYGQSNQHLAYLQALRAEKINRFVYLATDFRNVFYEDYNYQPAFEDTLKSNIARFFDYLQSDKEMNQAYQNYCTRKEQILCDLIQQTK